MTATPIAGSLEQRVEALLASEQDAVAAGPAILRDLRDAGPAHWYGPRLLVTGYEDVRSVLRDPRFSADRQSGSAVQQNLGHLTPDERQAFDELRAFTRNWVALKDGEEHDRLRRIALRALTPRRIVALADATQRYLDDLLEPLLEQETVELMDVAYRLPLQIIGDLLGVPPADRDLIHDWAWPIGRNRLGTDPGPMLEAHAGVGAFRAYIDGRLEETRGAPPESDLAAALMDAEQDERLTAEELTAMFVLLLTAGHETTTNLIGTGMWELLRRRDQWRILCADPAGRAAAATEELLRYAPPIVWETRVPLVDLEIGGIDVPARTTVFAIIGSANRDPAAFAEPEQLDVTRADASRHLSFGYGPHFCLGAALARLEATIFLQTVATRFPGMEVATGAVEWRGHAALPRIASLPVRLGTSEGGP